MKIGSQAPFGLRMPPDLKARVDASAKSNRRSMNSEIVLHLERAFPAPAANSQADAASTQTPGDGRQ